MCAFNINDYTTFKHMSSGGWYLANSPELHALALQSEKLYQEYNNLGPDDDGRRQEILSQWLHPDSGRCEILAPVIIEYGKNTCIADEVFINFGLTILDIAPVSIGQRSMLGPNCQLLTAGHPVNDAEMRAGNWEKGAPISIGEDVWLGGGVIVVGGVSIGNRVVVGAGAVVTRGIPDDAIAVGNPARVIKTRDENNLERTQLPEGAEVDGIAQLMRARRATEN